jgi:hypothetical protein
MAYQNKLDWLKLNLSNPSKTVADALAKRAKAIEAMKPYREAVAEAEAIVAKSVEAALVKAKRMDPATEEVKLNLRWGIDRASYATAPKSAAKAATTNDPDALAI